MKAFFFDTYAFYEIIIGNRNYEKYTKDIKIFTSQLNLMELYYQLLLLYDEQTAKHFYKKYEEFVFPITEDTIFRAMKFKKLHKKRKMSYADCIGYAIAQKLNISFLTGDKEFKDFEKVEFVK